MRNLITDPLVGLIAVVCLVVAGYLGALVMRERSARRRLVERKRQRQDSWEYD
jgi:hypothetical protein